MPYAAVFPGQGSQSTGMLETLAQDFTIVKHTFEQAADTLGRDLWQIIQNPDPADLNQTINTQPAMLVADIAVWRTWLSQGGAMPAAMAGHSLGEYAAVTAGGIISFEEALTLVHYRAEFMQQAVPAKIAGMAAILGLDDEVVIEVCASISTADNVVEAVNFNSKGQVVIAGHKVAVVQAIESLTERGAKRAIMLSVSVPSHSSLMREAADQLKQKFESITFEATGVPVIHNVSAIASTNASEIKQALAEQLYMPVQWVKTVDYLQSEYAIDAMIEFGPGKVLTTLAKRIDKSMASVCIHDAKSLDDALKLMQ